MHQNIILHLLRMTSFSFRKNIFNEQVNYNNLFFFFYKYSYIEV